MDNLMTKLGFEKLQEHSTNVEREKYASALVMTAAIE